MTSGAIRKSRACRQVHTALAEDQAPLARQADHSGGASQPQPQFPGQRPPLPLVDQQQHLAGQIHLGHPISSASGLSPLSTTTGHSFAGRSEVVWLFWTAPIVNL